MIEVQNLKFAVTVTLFLYCALFRAQGAPFYDISDPFMAQYEGFWTANNGNKGRLSAQIRPLSNNRYDGFILFVRAKSPVTAVKLVPASEENGVLRFTGASIENTSNDLPAHSELSCELRDGKISGTFKGKLVEGTI